MCNLYNISTGPQAILEFTKAVTNHAWNLEPGKIYPVYEAQIVRTGDDGKREFVKARWECRRRRISLKARRLTRA